MRGKVSPSGGLCSLIPVESVGVARDEKGVALRAGYNSIIGVEVIDLSEEEILRTLKCAFGR